MKKPTLLLIEQDAWLADMYIKKLEADYSVTQAKDAQSAIDVLDNNKISLIITDLQLGRHNGVEVIHEVRSYDDWLDIPIIVLSSLPNNDVGLSSSQMDKYNICAFLYKHQSLPQDLLNKVQATLK